METAPFAPWIVLLIASFGVGRVLLGLAPFVAAAPASRLLGFPSEHDNPSARLMARLFGVRDIGLGVLIWYALANPLFLSFALLFNAMMDSGDLVSTAIPLAKRQGIDRGALTTAACALAGGCCWIVAWFLVYG